MSNNQWESLLVSYWGETSDLTKIEQFTFVVRFADNNLIIQERFLGFWTTPDTKAETLFQLTGNFP